MLKETTIGMDHAPTPGPNDKYVEAPSFNRLVLFLSRSSERKSLETALHNLPSLTIHALNVVVELYIMPKVD